jgi:lipid-A-disaccharide synthase
MPPTDILILSNGPGEVSTWVRPVVQALRQQLGWNRQELRLSLVLSPCSHATGQEAAIARRYPEIDRVQEAQHFFRFLLWGQTPENWDWHDRGIVLFLGGDQAFAVILGKRLGYAIVVYAEWEARWLAWVDRFGVMSPTLLAQAPPAYAHKFTLVGDLMAEAGSFQNSEFGIRNSEFGGWDSPLGEAALEGLGEISSSLSESQIQPNSVSKASLQEQPRSRSVSVRAASPQEKGETPNSEFRIPNSEFQIGLLPGSKAAKLGIGVPFMLAIAEVMQDHCPHLCFWIPVAPTLTLEALARFAQSQHNPLIPVMNGVTAELIPASGEAPAYLQTAKGLRVELYTPFPAYDRLAQCQLCLTTIGANTAELGALTVPMLVLLPTQQMDVMRAWDGIPGLLANLPGVGSFLAKVINFWFLQRMGLLAWPNIWAGKAIVPELVGRLTPDQVAAIALDYLQHPEKLEAMRSSLKQVRGEAGAAQKLVKIMTELL